MAKVVKKGKHEQIWPEVRLGGAAAVFAADGPNKPIVILIPKTPAKYIVRIAPPGPSTKKLYGLAFKIGERSMRLEATIDEVGRNVIRTPFAACRVRRLYPQADFAVAFDFPEAIYPRIFEPKRWTNGTFEFTVYKARLQL